MKNNLFLADLTQYHISATLKELPIAVDLDAPNTQYCGCVVNVRPRGWAREVNGSSKVCVHVCEGGRCVYMCVCEDGRCVYMCVCVRMGGVCTRVCVRMGGVCEDGRCVYMCVCV